MKKFITKYWGVGLVIVLLSSLFIAAAPTSAADPLNWEVKIDAPSGLFSVLSPGTDVVDYDVAPGGMTMYAVTGVNLATAKAVMQSTNGGATWTDITARVPADVATADFVAIAPDDSNVVVVATDNAAATKLAAAISVNGGSTFTSMGFIQQLDGTQAISTVRGISISATVTGGIRYIAVYGTSTDGDAAIYYYNYGAGVGTWKDAVTDFGSGTPPAATDTDTVAFSFSPSFPSDYMGVALVAQEGVGASDSIKLHLLSFNLAGSWNAETNYPVTVYDTAGAATTVNKADLALHPDYDGADEALRIAFVGVSVLDNITEEGGVWRCYDNAPAAMILGTATAGIGVASVAFDGTNLVSGEYNTNNVYRSADPMTTNPTFLPARTLKKIGVDDAGADIVLVKFVGETLYGAKSGDASGISKSLDYGNTWNDFTLLDSGVGFGPGTIMDMYMSAETGDPWYLVAQDAGEVSVYRIAMFSVTRVLCVPYVAQNMILRGIGTDADVIYAADLGGTVIYYSADAGLGRWYQRSSIPIGAIADLTAESAQVIYIGDGASTNVYKSINAGFTWALPVNCQLSGGNSVNVITSLAENQLVVGGTMGGVTYSIDGGTTWTNTMGVLNTFGAVQVAATGLETGDYLFAADETDTTVWRCELGPANFLGEFKSMNAPAQGLTTGETNTGMVLWQGVLYVLSADTTTANTTYINRTLAPTIPGTHGAIFWGTQYGPEAGVGAMAAAPSALKVSGGAPGSVMLYGFDQANSVWYFDDAVALNGVSLLGPADNSRVNIVSPLTGASAAVNFTWSRLSKATGYFLFIALDEMFTELLGAPIAVGTGALPNTLDPVSSIQPGTTFQAGTTYYWRVATYLPVSSGFSETRSFTVQPTAASVPSPSSPENGGSIDNTTPGFSWTPVSGATMYQFQLSADPAFGTTLMDEELAGAGIVSSATLERGKQYFWRVRALAPVEGDWSTVANFEVAMEAAAPAPPVVIEQTPAPVIEIPPAPPANVIEIPPAPAPEQIAPAYIWAIIIIGAVLVIAVIVLIVRTRRSV